MNDFQLFTNNAVALLAENISAGDMEIKVAPGYGYLFPQPSRPEHFFLVTLAKTNAPHSPNEIIRCSDRVGDTLIVAPNGRGYESSGAESWEMATTLVDHRITAETLQRLQAPLGANKADLTIDPNQTRFVNTFQVSPTNPTCKWMVTVIKPDESKVRIFEVLAIHRALEVNPSFSVYGVVGDKIDMQVAVTQTANDMSIRIINNEDTELTVNILRIQHN